MDRPKTTKGWAEYIADKLVKFNVVGVAKKEGCAADLEVFLQEFSNFVINRLTSDPDFESKMKIYRERNL